MLAFAFRLGPLQIQRKVIARKEIQRIVRNAAEVQRPTKARAVKIFVSSLPISLKPNERNKQLTEAEAKQYENRTTGHVVTVFEVLKSFGGPVNMFELAVNPTSFSQTVENLFFLSFLAQQERARVYVAEDDGMPYIVAQDQAADEQENEEAADDGTKRATGNRHVIFDITEAQWRTLVDLFQITESAIPTRKYDASGR